MRKLAVVPVGAMIIAMTLVMGQAPAAFAGKSARQLKIEAKRAQIDEEAQAALKRLFAINPKAKSLFEHSYGWAVFDNLKLAFGLSGGGGHGVAVDLHTGKRIYMKMGTAGIGFGLGGQKYQVIFFFQDRQTFEDFVNKGWKADAAAKAALGSQGINAKTTFTNGIAVYQLTKKGLMLNADISGTKYWRDKKLNRAE